MICGWSSSCCAAWSALKRAAPSDCKCLATRDLPDPIPPRMPMIGLCGDKCCVLIWIMVKNVDLSG